MSDKPNPTPIDLRAARRNAEQGTPQPGDTLMALDRDRWFEVTAVSPGGYHVSGYVGFDHARHGSVSGVRLVDVLAWVNHQTTFFPMPAEDTEDPS
jgi:hypothetical protein